VARPLLERAWVGARIKRLLYQRDTMAAQDGDLREALRHQIIDLSTKHRVLCDFTALLVLETEADYARFHIDRRALSDILTVGATGIEVLNRRAGSSDQMVLQPVRPPMNPGREEDDRNVEDAKDEVSRPSDRAKNKRAAVEREAGGASVQTSSPARAPAKSMEQKAEERPSAPATEENEKSSMARGGQARPMSGAAPGAAAQPEPAMAPPPAPRPAREAPRMRPPVNSDEEASRDGRSDRMMARRAPVLVARPEVPREEAPERFVNPYEGKLHEVMELLKHQRANEALRTAQKWREGDAGDVLALIALGEVYEAMGEWRQAARAYGSILDLFPGRADLRRFAGSRLERVALKWQPSLELAADTFGKARASRADHPNSHRFLAYAQLRLGRFSEAFETIVGATTQQYPRDRFRGVENILADDVGLIAAAWIAKEPSKKPELLRRLSSMGVELPTQASLRFVLSWETDANDVDFHIHDAQGGHAWYSQRQLPSGGELYADVTTGYGPECFAIPLESKRRVYPYRLRAHYYSRGPMGYGMGKLQIVEHDGNGGLKFVDRPFVIMVDGAFVDLGVVSGPLR
jgi:tetratricopeptide (TPR) repeat protein